MLGCGDHSCLFKKPVGVGTNGGCRCLSELPDRKKRRELEQYVVRLQKHAKEQAALLRECAMTASFVSADRNAPVMTLRARISRLLQEEV